MRRWWQDSRGFSLVELVVALAVMSVTAGAIYALFFSGLKAYWKGDIMTQTQQGGRVAIDRLSRDLRQARRLINGVTASGFTFNTNDPTNCGNTSAPQISFVQPALGQIALSDGTNTYQIFGTLANTSDVMPIDGYYVSYYLATSNTTGSTPPSPAAATGNPMFLIMVQYTLSPPASTASLSWSTVASDVTGLAFARQPAQSGNYCPDTTSREVTVTLTAGQNAVSQGVSSTDNIALDVSMRNQ